MSKLYDFIVFDAQYYLFRNSCIICYKDDYTYMDFVTSFMYSILKLYKEFGSGKVILVWDKGPYRKLSTIKTYKKDRVNSYNEYSNVELSLKDPNLTSDERLELENQLKQIEKDIHRLEVFNEAKEFIKTNMSEFGMVSLEIPGFEADDLAYYLSLKISNLDLSGAIVSSDSDWFGFATDKVDFFHTAKSDYRIWSKQEIIDDDIPLEFKDKIDLFDFYQVSNLFDGNHNNICFSENYVMNFTKSEFMTDLVNGIELSKYGEVNDFFQALSIRNYYSEVESNIEYTLLKDGEVSKSLYWKFVENTNFMGSNPYTYWNFLKKLESKYYDSSGLGDIL